MRRLACLCLILMSAAACGSRDKTPASSSRPDIAGPTGDYGAVGRMPSRYKVGSPYHIRGQRYVPEERFEYVETGQASWYGPGFHGAKTANGEIYDQNAMTAAHRTLQMPSVIRVTNVGNGRSVVLRVNDRGPYHGGRVLDVSEAAAKALDFKRYGTALVRIEVLGGPSRAAALRAQSGATVDELEAIRQLASTDAYASGGGGNVVASARREEHLAAIGRDVGDVGPVSDQAYVQAGAFAAAANARALESRLRRLGPTEVMPTLVRDRQLYRVRIGPYATVREAELVLAEVMALGGDGAHVVVVQ